jgi:cobalt-precorrin-5B (C1)-methyltransferase
MTTVELSEGGDIVFSSGPGVGTMTKPGLAIPVGEPAINPVPREFMAREFKFSLEKIKEKFHWKSPGIRITVSIPDGEERSKKTLNGRLGIVGGLSILGTKGIVVPFSTAAYRASITQAIEVAYAQNIKTVVMTTGGQSEAFAARILSHLPPEAFIQIGDFTGYSIRQAARIGIEMVILAGFLGKFSKLAKGVTQTHAAGSQVDLGFLVDLARETGSPEEVCDRIRLANTARHVGEIIEESGNRDFFNLLCKNIIHHVGKIKPHPTHVEVLLTNFKGEQIGYSRTGE